jgi:LPS export ABC transporter protein LptC
VQEVGRKRAVAVGLRAKLPMVARYFALSVIVAGTVYVAISYYRLRNNKPFVMIPGAPQLDTTVVSEIHGYERRVTEGEKLRLLVKASKDITFSDGHHELEDVLVESYPATGDKPDKITAKRSIYDQENQIISFKGSVNIETRDELKASSDVIVYNQKTEWAEAPSPLNFTRENVSGSANSGSVDAKNKLLKLQGNVAINVAPGNGSGTIPTKADSQPVTIRSIQAEFNHASMQLIFSGGATAEQGTDVMSGDILSGTLSDKKQLQKVETKGNAYVRAGAPGHAAEIHSRDMDFFLDENQQLQRAVATGDIKARTLDADSQVDVSGPSGLEALFQLQAERSVLKEMHTSGRSLVKMAAPQSRINDPKSARKQLSADTINLFWRVNGRDLERAEAVGNAELIVEPVQSSPGAEKKTLTAPRFDGEFFESGNLAKTFVAGTGAKAVIEPLQQSEGKGPRTLTSQKMTANFVRETQDVEHFEAAGDARFNELDRNGKADNVTYVAAEAMVRLRGGEPTVWDSRARTKANEIDSDLNKSISYSRGKASTTYYSQEQTNGATPFSNVKSPVYATADSAEFQHLSGVAIYSGNARLWQEDNFVRAEKITILRDARRLDAETRVQSALYQSKKKGENGGTSTVPVFATSDRMWYSDPDRLLHYDGNVDIKQATDRLTGEVADVYLMKDKGEVDRTIAQRNVVITQPGRKGTGDWAEYVAVDQSVVLKGNPAHVEDVEQGTTESGRLTIYMSDNRVVADDVRGAQSPGRVRSVHKVKRQE